MNKLKSHLNSFSGKITLSVMLGISLIAVTVSFVVLYMSRQVFSQNYGDSQEKVFEQIAAYNLLLHVDYLVMSNGLQHYCCRMDYENRRYEFLKDIPDYKDIAQQ